MKCLSVVVCLILSFSNAEAKVFNLRINPLGLLFGIPNATLDLKISNPITIGPEGGYFSGNFTTTSSTNSTESTVSITGSEYGVRMNLFFNGQAFSDGWYLGPFYDYLSIKGSGGGVTASASMNIYGAYIGYMWMWETFNIMFGAGLGSSSNNKITKTDIATGVTTTQTLPYFSSSYTTFEFTLGWAF